MRALSRAECEFCDDFFWGSVVADCHVFVASFGAQPESGEVLRVMGDCFEFAGLCGGDNVTGCSGLDYIPESLQLPDDMLLHKPYMAY
jgi:hypothetical protein